MNGKKLGPVWPWYVLAAALVIVDQIVKWLVRTHMYVGEQRPLIPHFIELLYVENTGAAFSLFAEHTWVLTLISAVVTVVLLFVLPMRKLVDDNWGRVAITLLLAGAAGNLIDRALAGSVTDMFNFAFITFGIFNVADICVTVGVVVFIIFLLRQGGEEKRDADAGTDRPE